MTLSPALVAADVIRRVKQVRSRAVLRHDLAETTRTLDRMRSACNHAVQGHVNARNEADVQRRRAVVAESELAELRRRVQPGSFEAQRAQFLANLGALEGKAAELQGRLDEALDVLDRRDGFARPRVGGVAS